MTATITTRTDGPTTIRTDREALTFTIERTFDAPRPLVFKAWSSCDYLTRWWGPTGWTVPTCEMDFRPGGTWFYGMQGPADDPKWSKVIAYGKMTYREIVEPVLLAYVDQFADASGNAMPDMPEAVGTVDFVEIDGRTKVINTTTYASTADLEKVLGMGMEEGVTQTWDRLDEVLASETTAA
jgi:uncharacterized protein YndB with AHSA1/START domain